MNIGRDLAQSLAGWKKIWWTEILGGTDAWATPTSNFGGGVPPKSPPMIMKNALYYHFFKTSQFSSTGIGI